MSKPPPRQRRPLSPLRVALAATAIAVAVALSAAVAFGSTDDTAATGGSIAEMAATGGTTASGATTTTTTTTAVNPGTGGGTAAPTGSTTTVATTTTASTHTTTTTTPTTTTTTTTTTKLSYPYLTGITDQQTEMFSNPLWTQLHTQITRYIVPYDVVAHAYDLTLARTWIKDAEAAHQQILIAFYHSEYDPTKLPGIPDYRRDIEAFIKMFPKITEYEPWDEANRGDEPHRFSSPSAVMAAQYYQVVIRACHSCTVVGLSVLDQADVTPTLKYISQFKSEIGRLKTVMPKVWGLNNYSDINYLQDYRTREIAHEIPPTAQLWLTETGGIVKFGTAFTNKDGAGDRRAAKALQYMFEVAGEFAKIRRLYIYQWTGSGPDAIWDSGLMDRFYHPRPGYLVVCEHQHAARCDMATVHD